MPTPGVVWRHLAKKMDCCGCAPLAVEKICANLEAIEAKGLVCTCACANADAIDLKRRADNRNVETKTSVAGELASLR